MEQERKMVSLSKDDVEWFERIYGGASLSWVLGELLTNFRHAHTLTPLDYAAIAAKALHEKVEDGL